MDNGELKQFAKRNAYILPSRERVQPVVNDMPVAYQSRRVTDPQGDGCHHFDFRKTKILFVTERPKKS